MLLDRSLILALVWQLSSVEGAYENSGHGDDWNNWIILPARSRRSDVGALHSFSDFRINESDASNYLDPVRIKPYTIKIKAKNHRKRERHTKVKKNDDDVADEDLIVPLGRAMEKVKDFYVLFKEFFDEENYLDNEGRAPVGTTRKTKKLKKKFKKFLLPLLIAYKLKFLTLIPVLIGGLVLLVGTTGLAGFFFALFAAVMSLKTDSKLEIKKW